MNDSFIADIELAGLTKHKAIIMLSRIRLLKVLVDISFYDEDFQQNLGILDYVSHQNSRPEILPL